MHAYLIVGATANSQSTIDSLAKKLGTKILEFPIAKIEDARELNNLIRLSFDQPTLIVCQNIHEATEEALNAFLKNLEEPQENIFFALVTPSVGRLLPTIVSRCQIIKSTNDQIDQSANTKEVEKFLSMTTGEKLAYIDKIKSREDACKLVESTIDLLHSKLHSDRVSGAWSFRRGMVKYQGIAKNIELAVQTLTRLKGNGNVNLQLANFVIGYV